jgi:hypothetical protein
MEFSYELGVSPRPIDTPKCKFHLYIRAPFLGSPFRSLSGTGYRPLHGVISRKARQRPEAEHHGIEHKGVPAIHEGSEGSCAKTISPFASEFIFCSVNGEDRRTKKIHLIGKFMPA